VAVLALAQSNSNEFLDDYLTPLLKGFSNDREIMLGAIRQNPQLFEKASATLKKDPKFVMAAIEARGEAIQFAPKQFQQNADFVMAALKDDKFRLDSFDVTVDFSAQLGDKKFARELIKANGARLRDLSAELKGDPEIVALATAQSWRNITFASEKLQTDPAFLARVGVPSAD